MKGFDRKVPARARRLVQGACRPFTPAIARHCTGTSAGWPTNVCAFLLARRRIEARPSRRWFRPETPRPVADAVAQIVLTQRSVSPAECFCSPISAFLSEGPEERDDLVLLSPAERAVVVDDEGRLPGVAQDRLVERQRRTSCMWRSCVRTPKAAAFAACWRSPGLHSGRCRRRCRRHAAGSRCTDG